MRQDQFLPETLEHVRQKLRRDAWSSVTDFDRRVRFILCHTNADDTFTVKAQAKYY